MSGADDNSEVGQDAVTEVVEEFSLKAYSSIEHLEKNNNLFHLGEPVVLTEKIHGANARYRVMQDGTYVVGRRQEISKSPGDPWHIAAEKINVKEKIAGLSNFVFFGEVYGKVQKLRYGLNNEVALRFFDIFDIKENVYLGWSDFAKLTSALDLPIVPLLYRGAWREDLIQLASGQSTIQGADHIREGFVIRPEIERYSNVLKGRLILKCVSADYNTERKKSVGSEALEKVSAVTSQLTELETRFSAIEHRLDMMDLAFFKTQTIRDSVGRGS